MPTRNHEHELEEPTLAAVDDIQDIDPDEWLSSTSEAVTDHVVITVKGQRRRLKIAALTEAEFNDQLQASRKFDPKTKQRKPNSELFKLMMVALSINKAHGRVGPNGEFLANSLNHEQLKRQLAGQVTEVQKAIAELSGFELGDSAAEQARAFFD